MKLDELIQRVGVDNVGVQMLHESITGAKQRRGYVEVSFGTDSVSMRDIAVGQWDNIVFVVSRSVKLSRPPGTPRKSSRKRDHPTMLRSSGRVMSPKCSSSTRNSAASRTRCSASG